MCCINGIVKGLLVGWLFGDDDGRRDEDDGLCPEDDGPRPEDNGPPVL